MRIRAIRAVTFSLIAQSRRRLVAETAPARLPFGAARQFSAGGGRKCADEAPVRTPATDEELAFSLAFALRHGGTRVFRGAEDFMAKLTAAPLLNT